MEISFYNLKKFYDFIESNLNHADYEVDHYIKQLILNAYITSKRFYLLEADQTKTGTEQKIHFSYSRYYNSDSDEDIIRIEF